MANSAQARKRARQSQKNRAHNASLRTAFRTAVKKVLKVVESGDKAAAQAFGTQVYPTSFLINKKGEILKTFVGEPDFAALYQEIDKELAK